MLIIRELMPSYAAIMPKHMVQHNQVFCKRVYLETRVRALNEKRNRFRSEDQIEGLFITAASGGHGPMSTRAGYSAESAGSVPFLVLAVLLLVQIAARNPLP